MCWRHPQPLLLHLQRAPAFKDRNGALATSLPEKKTARDAARCLTANLTNKPSSCRLITCWVATTKPNQRGEGLGQRY